jgi:hypothetical protein
MTPRFVFVIFTIAFTVAVTFAAITTRRHVANTHVAISSSTPL